MEAAPGIEDYPSPDANVLFKDDILKKLDCSKSSLTAHGVSYANPGPGLAVRPLERTDYDKGFLSLLSQLTKVGDYSKEKFEAQFDAMREMPGCHYVVVIEDTSCPPGKVVCSGTLVVERKFIHNAALRGRIEDIVVDKDYRKLRLGSMIVELLTVLSRELHCYKVTLDCKEEIQDFYKKFGYVNEGQVYLSKRFFD